MTSDAGCQWWEEDADKVYATVEAVAEQRTYRRDDILRSLRLYGDTPILGWGPGSYTRRVDYDYDPLSYNVVRSVTDTAHAEIIASRPRPQFLTSGGDFELRQRADRLGKFCEGVYYTARGDREAARCAFDLVLLGKGFLKVFDAHDRVCIERVFPGEIFVDERDALYGDPSCLYQVRHVDRARLRRLYPKADRAIEDATAGDDWQLYTLGHQSTDTADMVRVVEAWHLPSGPDSGDGKHVVATSAGVLFEEEWEDECFPFAACEWMPAPLGFWPEGVGTQLRGIQFEINRLLEDIRAAQKLMGNYKVFVERGSKIVKGHLSNLNGAIVEYSGTPPTFATFQAVNPEIYQQLDRLYAKAFELVGVSAMNAQAQKPSGLDSGRALRAFSDITSKRFLAPARSYEEMHIEVARLTIACAKRIAKRVPGYDVVYRGRDRIDRIAWEDVDLDADQYVLQCFPVSALPNTPAGRLASLQDLFNAGLVDKESFLELADFPDLESARKRATAPRDVIEKRLDRMISDGEYMPPEGFFDLAQCVTQGMLAYAQAQLDGVPQERLDLVHDWIVESQELLARSQAPAAPAAPPPGAPPPMPGDAPPPPDMAPAAPTAPPMVA